MSITIFRKIRGRIVPIVVDEQHASEYSMQEYKRTPKHQVRKNKFDTFISFTIPNATCQSCGKDVFYYENSNGSRVLFDSLGPPWPIHPCYETARITKKKNTYIVESGWEPVLVEKYVITSSGGLRIQGLLGNMKIRFIFDASDFSRMKLDLSDVQNLIVFASIDKGSVQTHNGKGIFKTHYEIVNQKKDELLSYAHPNNLNIDDKLKEIRIIDTTNINTPANILKIKLIKVVLTVSERMGAIISGSLNGRHVNYLCSDDRRLDDVLEYLGPHNSCIVKFEIDTVTLEIYSKKIGDMVTFNVSYLKQNEANAMTRIDSGLNEKNVAMKNILIKSKKKRNSVLNIIYAEKAKKRNVSLEEQIGKLALKISTPMSEAFSNAKKK